MKKILIIEDDVSIAELIRDYLEISGYEVKIDGEGVGGLNSALTGEFSLAIVDIMLPGLDGFEILRKLRAESDMPVLLVSARKEDIDKIRGLGLGADDYITKPFSPAELVARVGSHLARVERLRKGAHEAPAKRVISIRGLRIDIDAHRVFVYDKEVSLTNKEYDLLLFLAENPNRVYSKEQLLYKVWGYESFSDTATIAVHIKRVREKTERDPQNPEFIETVWGAGYRFSIKE
jgi:DNA-binding response OmpR family regulator